MKSILMRAMSTAALAILLLSGREVLAQEFKYKVEHDHMLKSCKGLLVIDNEGVEYQTEEKDHARSWAFRDIQMLKLASPKKLKIITYESAPKTLGRDRGFVFKVLEGEITKELSELLLARVERPLSTSFVISEEKALYEFPARHQHRLSGCDGAIRVYSDRLVYESNKPENSRYWRWSDIRSISRTGPYQFSVSSYEQKFGGSKTYTFDLKEQLEESVYDYVWGKINMIKLPQTYEGKQ